MILEQIQINKEEPQNKKSERSEDVISDTNIKNNNNIGNLYNNKTSDFGNEKGLGNEGGESKGGELGQAGEKSPSGERSQEGLSDTNELAKQAGEAACRTGDGKGAESEQITSDAKKTIGEFKLFDLYDVSEIKVNDLGMKKYINLDPKLVVKSHGRIREKFSRAKVNLLELFANLIAVPGHRGKKHKIQTGWKTGKYSQNMKIVLDCLEIIRNRTKENPVQVLVSAIENAAPRDGVTVIEYGGARYPQAVDLSPIRRVTMTLRNIIQGSYDKSFNKKTKIEQALADEIIKAYKGDVDSFSMTKRKESEKQADSAR